MKSKAYWVKRAVEVETYLQSQADSVKDGVIKAYERAIKNVNNDIEKTFKAYISTDIPEKEARRLMSIADSDKQYEELLELYAETDDKTVKKEILNRINAQAYGARISRLEGLKRNVYIYFRRVANEAIKEQKKLYDSAVKTAYYTNIFDTAQGLNCGIDFPLVPQKAVNKVLSEPWHGHNYSERVWIHNDRFIQAVGQTIEDGIISGHSVSRMTDKLIDYVKDTAPGGIRTSAETLVRSETAHFMNQGQRMAYEEIGIKQYRFVAALSELTCDRCGSLDGSVFDTDKAVEGENFPPIHPRCRCVTIMADVNLSTRIARDPLTGENYKVDGGMTFNEWKNSLSDEQKNALKYVANSEKRGIIKVDKEERHHMSKSADVDYWKDTKPILNTKVDLDKEREYAKANNINLILSNKFDGDTKLLREQVSTVRKIMDDFSIKDKLTLEIANLYNGDFGETVNNTIRISNQALRDKIITEKILNSDNILASTKINGIAAHECGHIIANKIGNKGIEIAKKAYCNINSTENISTVEILDYLETNISSYSISILNGKKNKKFKQSYYKEIISEVLAKGYTNPNKFAMEFFKILKEEYL